MAMIPKYSNLYVLLIFISIFSFDLRQLTEPWPCLSTACFPYYTIVNSRVVLSLGEFHFSASSRVLCPEIDPYDIIDNKRSRLDLKTFTSPIVGLVCRRQVIEQHSPSKVRLLQYHVLYLMATSEILALCSLFFF